jgi:hypothetical protein
MHVTLKVHFRVHTNQPVDSSDRILSQTNPVYVPTLGPTPNVILPSTARLGLSVNFFEKLSFVFLTRRNRTTQPASLILPDLIMLVIYNEK